MDLIRHYNNLYEDSIQKITTGNYQVDDLLDSPTDKRFGITLLIRPDSQVKKSIQDFLYKLKAIEPEQYYYPSSDIHVTVMSIISCYEGFKLTNISIGEYIKTIEESIKMQKDIKIQFQGITASPSCIMVQGFLHDNTLNNIRDNLRINFAGSSLQQSIDQRYSIQTAHSTVVRFRKKLTQKQDFLSRLEEYRNYNFGTTTVDALDLVFNDWYQRKEHVKELCQFKIK